MIWAEDSLTNTQLRTIGTIARTFRDGMANVPTDQKTKAYIILDVISINGLSGQLIIHKYIEELDIDPIV